MFAGMVIVLVAVLVRPDKSLEELKSTYTDSESRFISLQEMNVHYRREGAGPLVVLLHGTSSSLHTWEGWTRILIDTFRVIRLDLPGFGLTGPHPNHNYSMEMYTAFLREFLDSLQTGPIHLAGNSLGGQIAWEYAVRFPDHVRSLILLDAAGYPQPEETPLVMQLAQSRILSLFAQYLNPRFLVRKSLLEVYGNDALVTDSLVNRYTDLMLRKGNRKAFVQRVRQHGSPHQETIQEVSQPTLIMWGEQDEWIPVRDAYQFAENIPQARLRIYGGVGHLPMEEHPGRTGRDARNFLLQVEDNIQK